jgi:hypothetical protein
MICLLLYVISVILLAGIILWSCFYNDINDS